MNLMKAAAFLPVFTLLGFPAHAQRVVVESCRPQASAYFGGADNADRNGGQAESERKTTHLVPDVAAAVDIPVAQPWSVRTEIGRSFAAVFQDVDFKGAPLVRDSMSIDRLTLGGMKSSQPCGAPVRAYAGLGLGAYRYRFDRDGFSTVRGGVNGTAGVDIMISDRKALSAFIAVDGIDGPGRKPVFSTVLWVLRFGAGMTVRF